MLGWGKKLRGKNLCVSPVHLRWIDAVTFSESRSEWQRHSSDFQNLEDLEAIYVDCRILYNRKTSGEARADEPGNILSRLESNQDSNITVSQEYGKGSECAGHALAGILRRAVRQGALARLARAASRLRA